MVDLLFWRIMRLISVYKQTVIEAFLYVVPAQQPTRLLYSYGYMYDLRATGADSI